MIRDTYLTADIVRIRFSVAGVGPRNLAPTLESFNSEYESEKINWHSSYCEFGVQYKASRILGLWIYEEICNRNLISYHRVTSSSSPFRLELH